jgi:ATP-dependent exoDNAse (exonuclease V) beta subunit
LPTGLAAEGGAFAQRARFPVVILAKLSSGEWGELERRVVDREHGLVEFEVGKEDNRFRTPGFAAAAVRERAYERAQDARLMYVAATRSRGLLVIPVYKSEERPGNFIYLPGLPSWPAVVQSGYRDNPNGARMLLNADIKERTIEPPIGPTFGAHLPQTWSERMERLALLKTGGLKFIAPSTLVADEVKEPRETEPKDRSEDERDLDVQDDTDRALGAAAGAAGVSFVGSSSARRQGSLVHEVLYRCDLADPASAGEWARRLCSLRGLRELTPEVEEHARRILESDEMRLVLQATNGLREVPVAWFDAATEASAEHPMCLSSETTLCSRSQWRERRQEQVVASETQHCIEFRPPPVPYDRDDKQPHQLIGVRDEDIGEDILDRSHGNAGLSSDLSGSCLVAFDKVA